MLSATDVACLLGYRRWPLTPTLSSRPNAQGFRKPSREAFEACLRALDVPAAEVVFVDDRAVNVEAAAAAGLDGILFEGAEALEAALRARGLQF